VGFSRRKVEKTYDEVPLSQIESGRRGRRQRLGDYTKQECKKEIAEKEAPCFLPGFLSMWWWRGDQGLHESGPH